MKVLVTGNLGYIGGVLTPELESRGHSVVGYDIGYYEECLTSTDSVVFQIRKDIRDISAEDLQDIEAVIHLAALSNDSLGEIAEGVTEQINFDATIKLAKLAESTGVRRFVYASSQSVYGISNLGTELDEHASEKNPLTVYARTKWEAEQVLLRMSSEKFQVVAFRPSTVFGASNRLRCDIVFNNLVACAFTTGKIEIKSDGTPRRPVVHVRDVCSAFIAGLEAPSVIVNSQVYNVGILGGNFTVRDLAEAAQRAIPGSELIFTGEHGLDSRTYSVSFDRIFRDLSSYYKPSWNLDSGGTELVSLFREINLTEKDFRGRLTNRISQLRFLQFTGKLTKEMRYT